MCYRNGIFKTNLTKILKKSKFTIRMECKPDIQKQLLMLFDDFIKSINTDNIFIVIREFQSIVYRNNIYDYNDCKIGIVASDKEQNLYVPVV